MKKRYAMISLAVSMLLCSSVYAETMPTNENSFTKDNKQYITRTYTLENDEDISELTGGGFTLNGYTYTQVDMKSEPVVKVEEKEVEESEKTSVPSQNDALVLERLGATKEYSDEDGFAGVLELDTEKIKYTVESYTTRTYTKNASQMVYNLPSMDTSQVAKSIWSGGVQLYLTNIQWIGDNNNASADTAVGNNFHARAYYSGKYSVKVPSSYLAEVVYSGTVQKETSERTEYTVTYLGEQIIDESNEKLPFLIGFVVLDVLVLAGGIYLYRKLRKKNADAAEEEQENEEVEVYED